LNFREARLLPVDKIKILVADDHTMMRDGIRALLGNYDDIELVGETSNGKDTIEKAQVLAPDVIVMDIAMPDIDGLEATRCITNKNAGIKVLVLTQYDNKEYILSSIKAGAAGYLPNRAVGSELVSAIRILHRGDAFLPPHAAKALIDHYRQQAKEVEPYNRLTTREREVLKLIAEGHVSREIADILSISLNTVLNHRTKVMEKLNIHNRTELIRYALRKGLVNIDT